MSVIMADHQALECHQLAEFHQSVDHDFAKAAHMYEDLCANQGYGKSCLNLALLHVMGKGSAFHRLQTDT